MGDTRTLVAWTAWFARLRPPEVTLAVLACFFGSGMVTVGRAAVETWFVGPPTPGLVAVWLFNWTGGGLVGLSLVRWAQRRRRRSR